MPMGMLRSGWGCHHSSWNQSFQALVTSRPSSGSEHWLNTRPQKPVIWDGKFSAAQTPLMSMSFTRASMSQQPGRMSSKRVGSIFQSSRGRPTTALRPTCRKIFPSNSQTSWPSSVSTTRGAASWKRAGRRPSNMPGGSTRWSSTEITV